MTQMSRSNCKTIYIFKHECLFHVPQPTQKIVFIGENPEEEEEAITKLKRTKADIQLDENKKKQYIESSDSSTNASSVSQKSAQSTQRKYFQYF
ncbi:unnamed protein product [Caenorhabditis angaria]|uniref:Uncharacterized protein n=1 Tax=Caenorhabditis angaria TaxID=860376 RepID=A0A9P1IQ78_9PELO|nr:unnamed protein product [Caenorhabditis angaria]